MRRLVLTVAVLLGALAFCAGAALAVLSAPRKVHAQQPVYRGYRVDFRGRNCDFCGSNAAEWFEFSARKCNGAVCAQYFCGECRDFCRFR